MSRCQMHRRRSTAVSLAAFMFSWVRGPGAEARLAATHHAHQRAGHAGVSLQVFSGVDGTFHNNSGNDGLTREQSAVLCFLKERLADFYTLDPVPEEFRHGAPSCAAVSSSGAQLRHAGQGREIDAHGVVLRFNDAQTKGFEDIVGNRTTFRFGWNTCNAAGVCKTPSALSDAPALWPNRFYQSYPADVRRAHEEALKTLYGHPPGLGPAEKSPTAQSKVAERATDDDPTTGFYGMLTLLTHCAEVDAYEMAPSDAAGASPYSYYGAGEAGQALHPPFPKHGYYVAEHDLWSRLSTLSDEARRAFGRTRYPGFSRLACSEPSSEQGKRHGPQMAAPRRFPWPTSA